MWAVSSRPSTGCSTMTLSICDVSGVGDLGGTSHLNCVELTDHRHTRRASASL